MTPPDPAIPPMLGVIEGFYGRPWSWPERRRLIEFMAEHGFKAYVYAPKDDPPHRRRWREPHSPAALSDFRRLTRRCEQLGMRMVYGLSPIRLSPADRTGQEIIWAKFATQQDQEVHHFCLLFDDLPEDLPPGADLRAEAARWHAGLGNETLARLRARDSEAHLVLTPTEYHGATNTAYLRTLGEALDPAIDIHWTGPEVCSESICASDLTAVTEVLQRPPVIWDNYPVNDGGMRFDPHLRPVTGRCADLPGAVRGLLVNGALEAESSRIAMHTFAAYWADPQGYEPERTWREALLAVTGNRDDAEAVAVLGGLARRSPLERKLPGGPLAVAELKAAQQAAQRLSDRLANRGLAQDLAPWVRKLNAWIVAVEAARDPDHDLARKLLRTARRIGYHVADDRFMDTIRGLLNEPAS